MPATMSPDGNERSASPDGVLWDSDQPLPSQLLRDIEEWVPPDDIEPIVFLPSNANDGILPVDPFPSFADFLITDDGLALFNATPSPALGPLFTTPPHTPIRPQNLSGTSTITPMNVPDTPPFDLSMLLSSPDESPFPSTTSLSPGPSLSDDPSLPTPNPTPTKRSTLPFHH
jgi:hypothetical protein